MIQVLDGLVLLAVLQEAHALLKLVTLITPSVFL